MFNEFNTGDTVKLSIRIGALPVGYKTIIIATKDVKYLYGDNGQWVMIPEYGEWIDSVYCEKVNDVRDINSELKLIGLTDDQCREVMSLITTLPIETKDGVNAKVTINSNSHIIVEPI